MCVREENGFVLYAPIVIPCIFNCVSQQDRSRALGLVGVGRDNDGLCSSCLR